MRTREFDRFCRGVERSLPSPAPPRVEAGTFLRHWRGLREKDRGDCMSRLLKRLLQEQRSYGVALFLLEGLTEREHLYRFAEHLPPLPGPLDDDQECHLADLVRVLGATDDARTLPGVETYLLERPIAVYWRSVPWSLWPHRKELFGRAWERFFLEQPVDENSASVLATFLAEPEAVRCVGERLSRASAEIWSSVREALLELADDTEWLGKPERDALDRAAR